MNDNEIIKALGCCCEDTYCDGCPYKNKDECITSLNADALNLIKSQKAEIERLQKYNTDIAFKHYNDGMKEFAERLKAKEAIHFCKCGEPFVYTNLFNGEIDNLLEEMESERK